MKKTLLTFLILLSMPIVDGFAAGNYTLRIEAGNEVTVKQIVIPF